jgi:hypothetical protein
LLGEVRVVRNGVMHFDPDGVEPAELERLRQISSFLDRTLSVLE